MMLGPQHPGLSRALAVLVLALPAAAAGCQNASNPNAPRALAQERSEYIPGVSPIYCYRTLAEADCFAQAQPGPPNRLIDAYTDEP